MRSTIAGGIILLNCLAAWLLAGSPLPLGLSLVVAIIWLALKIFDLRIGYLYSFAIAVSCGCIEWYLFQTEQAFVVISDLPGAFHLGMVCHWFFWLSEADRKRNRTSGDIVFWTGLSGSVLILLSAGSVEILESPPWLIHLILTLPIVLIIWAEFFHLRKIRWAGLTMACVVSLGLAQASLFSDHGVNQLTEWLRWNSDEGLRETYDRDHSSDTERTTGGTDSRELARQSDISFTHKIRFYAQTDDASAFSNLTGKPIYVRTSTLAVFQSDSKIGPLRKGKWHYDSDDGTIDSSTRIAVGNSGDTFEYSILIHRSDVTQLPVLTGVRKIRTDSVYEFAEGWYQLSPPEDIEWLRFQAETVSEYSVFPEKNSSWVTSSIFPAPPESPYLALPQTALGDRIRKHTKRILKGLPPEKYPQSISGFLRGNCRYSLQYLNPENLPPVENFLFNERKGHCELFAAATVLMLRSAGIPSRIAYGYTGGQADPTSRIVAFRDSDFHSWAEILLADGHTWAVFDTTPVNPNSARHAPVIASLGKIDIDRYEDVGKVGYIPVDEGIFNGSALDTALEWMSLHFFRLIVGLPVFAALFLLFQKWRTGTFGKRRSGQTTESNPTVKPVTIEITFVDAILHLGKSYGFTKGSSQTLAEFVDQLRSNGIGNSDLFEAVDYAYSIRYSGRTRNAGIEKNFLRSIRKLISTAS